MAAGSGRRARPARQLLAAAVLVAACGGGAPAQGDKAAPPDAAAQGDGFEVSMLGYVSRTYDGDLASAVDGTRAALRQLGLQVTDESGGIFEKTLEAESAEGSLVAVAKEVARGRTRVAIKVGYLLGDRDAARRIHSEVETALGARAAEAEERKRRWRGGTAGSGPGAAGGPSGGQAGAGGAR